jgi:exodeoxyribonuclease VII small subunit
MNRKTDRSSKKEEGPNFEKALARLETIVGEMESGKLGLEQMIERFEEGQSLVRFCAAKLNEVERKIEILLKKGDEVAAEPFEPAAEPEPGGDTAREKDSDPLF